MANYQDNRIRCSKKTAAQLLTSEQDGYFAPIDFRKALGLPPQARIAWDVAYGWGCAVTGLADGRADIGFCTRWYSDLDVIRAFIAKYPDAEWWINQDWVEIYHYYWQGGEVIEDIHPLTEAESDALRARLDAYDEAGDTAEHYDMIFTPRQDQAQYVNLHPDAGSKAFQKYRALVDRFAHRIAAENKFFALKHYDYNWAGAYRHFGTCMDLRQQYLYTAEEDLSPYKLNIMSADVLAAVQQLVYPYNKKLYDAILGFAIGDALGVPYEFKERGTFTCKDMVGFGSHGQPAGTWSDDTSMTLATLKSLKDRHGKVDVADIRQNFLAWFRDGEFTANGDVFDIGNATHRALTTGEPCLGEHENGNGALMRILPLAFVDCADDEIRAVAAITHGHWISQQACVIYVHVARRLLAGERIQDIIPTLRYGKPFDRLCRINELEAQEIRSSGYVVDTLEAALWAVSHLDWNAAHTGYAAKGFSYDVLAAVSLGDDTDTVGAVTGGLAGILYGLDGTAERWLEALRNKEAILACLWP